MQESKEKNPKVKFTEKTWFVTIMTIFILFSLPIFGIVIIYLALFLSGIPVGKFPFEGEYTSEVPQFAFWVFVFTFTFFYAILKLLRRRKSQIAQFTRRYLIFCMVVGTIGCLIAMFTAYGTHVLRKETSSRSLCSLKDTLRISQAAVVPISSDNGSGTAFGITNNGHLVTAYHVIEGARNIYADWTTGRVKLKVIRTSAAHDLALLKLPAKHKGSSIKLTTNYDVPNRVYAVGWPSNAFTAGHASVSEGIVSRILDTKTLKLNSEGRRVPPHLRMIQTDTTVNPGNSGGPLINRCGVIGVVIAQSDSQNFGQYGLVSEQNINYAVSAETIRKVLRIK